MPRKANRKSQKLFHLEKAAKKFPCACFPFLAQHQLGGEWFEIRLKNKKKCL